MEKEFIQEKKRFIIQIVIKRKISSMSSDIEQILQRQCTNYEELEHITQEFTSTIKDFWNKFLN